MRGSGKPKKPSGFAEGRGAQKSTSKKRKNDPLAKLTETQEMINEALLDDNVLTEEDSELRFKREFKRLRKKTSAENDHFNADSVNRDMLRAMLTLVLDLLPIAEQAYRKTKRESAAYALNALFNQARELSMDLRLARDTGGQAEFIRSNIFMPIFTSFTQVLIQEIYSLKNVVDSTVQPKPGKKIKDEVDKMARSLGKFQTEMVNKLGTDIEGYLTGTLNVGGTAKKKK